MEIENISRIGFSSGGSSKKKRHLSVSHGLFGKIVIDNKGVFSVVSEIFSNSTGRIGSQKLKRGSFGSSGSNNNSIFESSLVF